MRQTIFLLPMSFKVAFFLQLLENFMSYKTPIRLVQSIGPVSDEITHNLEV